MRLSEINEAMLTSSMSKVAQGIMKQQLTKNPDTQLSQLVANALIKLKEKDIEATNDQLTTIAKHAMKGLDETASAGATSAGNIATMPNVIGGLQRRPSLFGYVQPPKKKRKSKKGRNN